jgi:hypothetical protein
LLVHGHEYVPYVGLGGDERVSSEADFEPFDKKRSEGRTPNWGPEIKELDPDWGPEPDERPKNHLNNRYAG